MEDKTLGTASQEPAQEPKLTVNNTSQQTIVKRKDKMLLAALGILVVAVAAVAIIGMLLLKPQEQTTQGQADCDEVRVSGKLSGRITKFYVKEGDFVHAGDTLVSITSKTIDASLYRAQKMHDVATSANQKTSKGTRDELKSAALHVLQQAQAAAEIASKTYQRMENLYKQGVITEQKRDEAKAAYDVAQAAVRTAQSQYQLAMAGPQQEDKASTRSLEEAARGTVMEVQALLDDQVLLAPCDGEVSDIYPHVGELVMIGTPIMAISKLADLWVAFNVREEMLNTMRMNSEVTATIPALGGKQAKFKIYYIRDMGSYATWQATKAYGQYDSKTFEVRARPVGKIDGFRPGMSVLLQQ